jgi:hypothetical protein
MGSYEPDPNAAAHLAELQRTLLDRASTDVLADVLAGCPVSPDGSNGHEPGYLREHQRRAIEEGTARIGSDVDYSVYVEDGHRVAYRDAHGEIVYTGKVVPPQPFLRDALNRQRRLG